MKILASSKRIIVIWLVLLLSGCVSTGPQNPSESAEHIEFGVPEIGAKAVWKTVQNGSESIKTNVFSKESFGGTMGYVWKTADQDAVNVRGLNTNNYVGTWSYSDGEWKATAMPHNGKLKFPLWVGKSYSADYDYWEKDGWSGRVLTKVQIEDWEELTVPAGTFKTLKIVHTSEYYKYTQWYSPELKMFVKYEGEFKESASQNGELIDFIYP